MLEYINDPNDIKQIQPEDYKLLAKDIRRFLLRNVSRTGGHLASNLGIVELTMALHLVLDFPKDQLIFDVGHQSYVHKILTGRKNGFENLRQFHGMSGFPKRKESDCDAFHSGHSSMSLSAALGMVTARDINHTDETIVAVIGDGALSGGMAYEALNNMARLRKEKKNLIIILNDNKMSIAENVGGMSAYLNKVRTRKEYVEFKGNVEQSLLRIPGIGKELTTILKKSKDSIKQLFVPGMYFEDMGITYIGPIDGHNVPLMVDTLNRAKQLDEPIIIHVVTKKGKGYRPAEQNPAKFHGISPFSLKTGEVLKKSDNPSNTAVFSDTLIKEAKKDKKIVAVTAAIGPPHCIPIRFTATNNEIAYTILPQSIAVKSEIYVPIFFLLNLNVLYIKPLTNPYTASSIIINVNLPTAGIPVKTELIIGENNPTKNPNTGPKTNPPSNTGMCIGKNT